jgi:hypothetical protein
VRRYTPLQVLLHCGLTRLMLTVHTKGNAIVDASHLRQSHGAIGVRSYPLRVREPDREQHRAGTRMGQDLTMDTVLFLDEVGDLHASAQAKLLRVIDTRDVQPVGTDIGERIDFHLIAGPTSISQLPSVKADSVGTCSSGYEEFPFWYLRFVITSKISVSWPHTSTGVPLKRLTRYHCS